MRYQEVQVTAEQQLKACAYEVVSVGSTVEAFNLPGRFSFDVVLAESDDLLRDKVSTEQFMARISGIPLILMSESECTTHVFQGIKLGAVDFLKRPLSELKLRVIWQHAVRKMMNDMAVPAIMQPPFNIAASPNAAESSMPGGLLLATTASQLSASPSVFPNVGITPCQLPLEGIGPSSKIEDIATDAAAVHNTSQGAKGGAGQGKQTPRERCGQGSIAPSDVPEPSKRRQRKSARDSSAQCVPSTATPPLNLGVPPLLGVPPGCIPPVAANGMAVGMPILNQPPFTPPPPMGLTPMAGVGNVPVVPFPSFPLVSVPTVTPSGQTTHWPGVSPAGTQSLPDQSLTISSPDDAADMAMDLEENEQAPLGLTLRKSPSLVNMISKNLEGVDIDV